MNDAEEVDVCTLPKVSGVGFQLVSSDSFSYIFTATSLEWSRTST